MKKHTIVFLISFLLIATATSCSKDEDDPTSPFYGSWTGTYTGDSDNGTFNVDISSSGVIAGTAQSALYHITYEINGNASNDGDFTATTGTTTPNTTFTGTLNGNSGSGTWLNNTAGYTGTWSAQKD